LAIALVCFLINKKRRGREDELPAEFLARDAVNYIRSFLEVIFPDAIPDPSVFLIPQPNTAGPEPRIRWDQ
jgi:hypothetical protein